MTKRSVLLAVFMLVASHALAQTPPAAPAAPTAPAAPAAPAPARPVAQTPKLLPPATIPAPFVPVPPTPPPAPRREGQPINVRVELTITETGAGAPPVKKTVIAVVGDGFNGSVREQSSLTSSTPVTPPERVIAPLNLDVTPVILADGKIRLSCTIQYQSNQRAADRQISTDIKQNLVLNLESGKALVISDASDPITDRRVAVEVTATILR